MLAEQIRVLLVEDDEDDYVLVRDLLSTITPSRFFLEWVRTYEAAWEAICSGRSNVFLLDYRLGERDGLELLNEATESGCKVPFIMLTGQEGYNVDMEAMRIGAADYLIKSQINATLLEWSIRYAIAHKRLHEQIRETSRLISIGSLAAGVAHEINNPLTVVLCYCELLLSEGLSGTSKSHVEAVYSQAQRMAKIVKNLSLFARNAATEKRFLRLKPILDRALEMKSHDCNLNNIKASFVLPLDFSRTMVYEQQLLQVFLNILTNAEQECVASHGAGQLVIRAVISGEKVRISISDDGPGILPENLNRIFEPFFTTKEAGKGTGLGLSICYGIIRQHDGNLWAESEVGEGATFHIELPVVSSEDEAEYEAAGSSPEPTRIPAPKPHLLVGDNEPLIRNLVAESLELQSYTVDLAEGGQEAWRKLQTIPYDCLVLDLKMPGMSGQEMFGLIEISKKELAGKVIFITGDTVNPDTCDFVASATNPVISKPFGLDDLHRQVLKVVESASSPAPV
jgi:two-component system NtrC family sensor kinase